MLTSTSEPYPLLLVLGMGYCARRFAARHRLSFARMAATVRDDVKASVLRSHGVETFNLEDHAASSDLIDVARQASHVLVSVPPTILGDPGWIAVGAALSESANLRWVGYLSTTAVYGDRDGAWTDETAPVLPQSVRAKRRADAEQAWRSLAGPECAVQVFRLSGIYGPGRNALADLKDGSAKRVVKPGQVFNRIHVEDVVSAVWAGLCRPEAGPVFNVADEEPAPSHEVVEFAAKLVGAELPPLTKFEDANLSDMARSFWFENKRVDAQRLHKELGVDLLYPTYREGLLALFAAGEGC